MRDVVGRVLEDQRRGDGGVSDDEPAHLDRPDRREECPEDHRRDLAITRQDVVRAPVDQVAVPATLALQDHFLVGGAQVVVDDRVEQHLRDRDGEDPPRRDDRQLAEHDDGYEHDDQYPECVGQDPREGGDEQLGERRHDGLALVPVVALVLLVVPVVHLDGMAHGTRRDEERHHQDERVEREADQVNEADPPDGRDDAGQGRPQGATPVVEVQPAQQPLEAPGHGEDPEDVARVAVYPPV